MTKVLLTGQSGTGKSYFARALADHGYKTYDIDDMPGMCRLENRQTGQPVAWPRGHVDWDVYAYNLQIEPFQKLLATDGDIFVAVVAANLQDFYPLFDVIITLTVDDRNVHLHRLRTRNAHEFGQDESNFQRIVERNAAKVAQLASLGTVIINTNQPESEVINEILKASHVTPAVVRANH